MAVLKYKNPNWDGTTASEEYLTLTISGGGTSFDDAPSDNNKYVRSNGSWVFNYDTYTYDGDYPSGSANIYGVNYTFKTGDIAETTSNGLVIRYNNEWFDLGIEKNITFAYTGSTTSSGSTKYSIDASVVETWFPILYKTPRWNYTINGHYIAKVTCTTSSNTSTASDNLSKTVTTTELFKDFCYSDYPRTWVLQKKTVKNYTRETTEAEFVDAGTDTITYTGYETKDPDCYSAYIQASGAYSLASDARSQASTAYSLASSANRSINSIQNALDKISTSYTTNAVSITSTTGGITLSNQSVVFVTSSASSLTLSYSYTANYYINNYTVLIKNSNSSEITFSLNGTSGDKLLGELPSTIASGGILELNFLRDKNSNCFYIRGIS